MIVYCTCANAAGFERRVSGEMKAFPRKLMLMTERPMFIKCDTRAKVAAEVGTAHCSQSSLGGMGEQRGKDGGGGRRAEDGEWGVEHMGEGARETREEEDREGRKRRTTLRTTRGCSRPALV